MKDVLVRNFKNFHDNEVSEIFDAKSNPLLARIPFLLKGEDWKEKRAEVTPALTPVRLNAMYPVIEDIQGRLVKYITEQIKTKKPLEARDLCSRYTIDVASNTILGIDAHSLSTKKSRIREMSKQLSAPTPSFLLKMMIAAAIPAMKKFLSLRFMAIETERFFVNLVDQALAYREKNNVQREDFLDYMIQLKEKKRLNHTDIACHTTLFFIDGFDTSSTVIAHALYEVKVSSLIRIIITLSFLCLPARQK